MKYKLLSLFKASAALLGLSIIAGIALFVVGGIINLVVHLFSAGWKAVTAALVALGMSSCSITVPVTATSNPLGPKTGHASALTVFGMCFNGDASVETAAMSGGITRIATVDFRTQNFLGIVKRHTCYVRGE